MRNRVSIMGSMKRHTKPWLGAWLNSVRLRTGVDVTDVAAKLNVHPSNIARRECGEQRIVADDIPSILAAYGVTVAQFTAKLREMAS